jgi:hypothetical protein
MSDAMQGVGILLGIPPADGYGAPFSISTLAKSRLKEILQR